jgi:hypothetical protein
MSAQITAILCRASLSANRTAPAAATPTKKQTITYHLVTDPIAQIIYGAHNAVIAPGAILPGHAGDQHFEILIDLRSFESLVQLGAIKLHDNQLAMPYQDDLWCDDRSHLCQRLLSQALADLSQCGPLAIAQPCTARDLLAQEAIFRDELLVAFEDLCIH